MRLSTPLLFRGRAAALALAAVFAGAPGAQAQEEPSFDCLRAATSVERVICADSGLRRSDAQMVELYTYMREISEPDVVATQQTRQQTWLRQRDATCALTEEQELLSDSRRRARECLSNMYRSRVNALQQVVPGELNPGGFNVSVDGLEPKVCFHFNGRLGERGQNSALEAFFDVQPAVEFGVERSYYESCLTGLAFGQEYKIILREGLPGYSGRRKMQTRRDFEFNVKVHNRSPALRFATNAHVVTRGAYAAMPFEAVNVKNVTARILHVDDADILAILPDRSHNLGALGAPPQHLAARLDDVAWAGTVRLNAELNETASAALPLAQMIDDLEPGIYLAALHGEPLQHIADEERRVRTRVDPVYHWFSVSDVGLSAYQAQDGLTISARDVRALTPMEAVQVSLISQSGATLVTAQTDADGAAHIPAGYLRGEGDDAPKRLYAYGPNGDFVSLDMTRPAFDLTDRGDAGRAAPDAMDAFLATERGIYRPGDKIYLTAVLSDAAARRIDGLPAQLRARRPDGRVVLRRTLQNQSGGYQTVIDTPPNAATGRWSFELAIGEGDDARVVGRASALVEDFQPPRVEVSAEARASLVQADRRVGIDVQADFLYGAPAAGLSGEAAVRISAPANPFPEHDGFRFGVVDDPRPSTKRLGVERFETDASGAALVMATARDLPDTAHPLRMSAKIDVFDVGGQPATTRVSLVVETAPFHLGVKSEFYGRASIDGETTFQVVAAKADGSAIAQDLTWRVIEETVDYIWYERNGRWRYRAVRDDVRELASGAVSTLDGGYGDISLQIDDWGDYRIEVEDPATGAMVSHRFFAGWAYNYSDSEPAPDMLRLSTAGGDMVPGGTATVRVTPPFDAALTVAVAGREVHSISNHRIPATGGEITIDLPEDAVGGVYALVSAYGAPDGRRSHAPTRAVGLLWLPFDMSARTLTAEIQAPEVMEPGHRETLRVAVPNADGAYVALAAVDDGVLGLTGFQTPNLPGYYYGQRRIGVELRDVYGRFIDAAGYDIGDIVVGGDARMSALNSAQTANLPVKTREIAAWVSPITPVVNGVAEVSYDALNEFDGRVRLMAMVWDADRVGVAEDTMLIRRPVVADISIPNFLAPDDVADMSMTLHNVAGTPGDYQLNVDITGPVQLKGPTALTATLDAGERETSRASIRAIELGDAEFNISVTGPDGFRYQETRKISVRPAAGYESRRLIARVAPGRSLEADPALLDPYFPSTQRMTVGVNPLPDLDAPSIIQSLNRYPYGCAEQTVSTALPLLLSERIAEPFGLEAASARGGMDAAIRRLQGYQTYDGGFSAWSSNGRSRPWLSVYVMEFLIRAADQGYDVSDVALERGVEYLQELARGGRGMSDQLAARAYAHYLLARIGAGDAQQLRRFSAVRFAQLSSTTARAHVGAALALIGDAGAAREAFKGAARVLPTSKVYYNFSYGSQMREYAALTALLAESGVADWDDIHGYAQDLSILIRTDSRLSTQESAWALRAAAALLDAPSAEIALDVDGERIIYASTAPFTRGGEGPEARQTPRIRNVGDTAVYGLISFGGVLREAPPEEINGFVVRRTLRNRDGAIISASSLEQNDLVVVVMEGAQTTPGQAEALLVDFLPAGLQIENAVSGGMASNELSWLQGLSNTETVELRLDRFVAAMNLQGGQQFKLAYLARVTTPGRFSWAGTVIEDMYQPESFGRAAPKQVIVSRSR